MSSYEKRKERIAELERKESELLDQFLAQDDVKDNVRDLIRDNFEYKIANNILKIIWLLSIILNIYLLFIR